MTAIFNFLMIAGSIQGFLFNIAIFFSRKKVEKPVLFLNLFVLFLSLNNLQSWSIDKGFIAFNYYTLPFYVFLAPMFHAFLIYYLRIKEKHKPYFFLTGFIFLLEFMARSIMIFLVKKGVFDNHQIELYNAIEDSLTLGFSLFIFYKVTQILFRYEKLYASILSFDDLKWIKRLIRLGGVILFLWGVAVFLNFVSNTIKPPHSYYPLRLATSIFIYWIGYQGFFRYLVLQDRIELRREIRKEKRYEKEIVGNRLDDPQKTDKGKAAFNTIDSYIKSNQKFLDPYLSLEKLCDELDTSSSSLSKIINTYAEVNFTDYINTLRVKEAKTLLGSQEFSSYTIVAIGLECGFNSKSTFYSAFKKFTGQTPAQYRNSNS